MGFFDLFRGSSSNNNSNQSYSNNEYDNDNYTDEEYDDYDNDYYSSDDYDNQAIDESDNKTHGIYSFEDTHEDWEWETDIVNYPHRGFDPWKTLESHFDQYYNFQEAEEYLKSYFRGSEKDIVYYFTMAYFYFRKAQDERLYEDIQRAKSHIDNAARSCNDDAIWLSLVNHIKDTIYYWHSALKEEKRLREDFKKEWGDLNYRIRYSNMDTLLPQMQALAQSIRHQLSNSQGSWDFLKSVESDLNLWKNRYATAKAEEFIKNGNLDEAAKTTSIISDMAIRGNLCVRIINGKLQNGDYDGAAKIATQIGDMGTQTLFSARVAAGKLLEMVKDKASEANIRRQLFAVEDVLRRASSLLKDNESFESLQKEIQKAVNNARNHLNGQPIDTLTVDAPTPISTTIKNEASTSNTNSANEAEFIEELKAYLEDVSITDKHRRLLDRIRKSLGISEERAAELEAMCQSKTLTAEEQEYADEVKACLEDEGVVTAKERRLLERLAKSLGISPERATEIEQIMK